MALKPAVEEAIKNLQKVFPESAVSPTEDGQGGAHIVIEPVPLDIQVFVQSETWVGFDLSFNLPYADVYPIYVRSDLARHDGRELKGKSEGLHPNKNFQGRSTLMLSRSNRDPEYDKPHLKVLRVLEWLRKWRCSE